jgi:hypothetical protein
MKGTNIVGRRSGGLCALLCVLTLTVLVGATALQAKAQSYCGTSSGKDFCPLGCTSGPMHWSGAVQGGNIYTVTATIDCAGSQKFCGYITGLIVQGSRCTAGSAIQAMTPEVYKSLRQVAATRDILVPGCGGSFKSLNEPPVVQASVRPGAKDRTGLELETFQIVW